MDQIQIKEQDEKDKTTHKLEPDMELRFEVDRNTSIQLELTSGMAEIFGTELVLNKKYTFISGAKVAVFSWHGCQISIWGKMEVVYTATSTPMVMYSNIHAALEQMRVKADKEMNRGPRVMVVGPVDVGKSTLCKLLVNYAARQRRAPVLVDLDVGQNDISIPGTIGALMVERPADVEDGYHLEAPLIYHFGHKTPESNVPLYNLLVTRLAEIVNMRSETSNKSNISGVVINTCGWIRGGGYQCLRHAASAFEIEVIVVMDQELLHSNLKKDMPDFVKVVLLPKSGGVVERNQKVRAERRDQHIRSYFYGVRGQLYPHTFEVKFADVHIYKIGAPQLPDSMLPLGMVVQDSRTKLVPIQPSGALEHHLVSTSLASSIEDDIVQSNVAGFVIITSVDMEKEVLVLLSPEPRPFPWNILLVMEDITFME